MNQRQIVSVMACILSCTLISRLRAEADSQPVPSTRPATQPTREIVDGFFKPIVDEGWAMGVSVAVVTDEGVRFYSYGKQSKEQTAPPDERTVYEIGSVSKVFTGLLLAELVEEGVVGLDDPLQKYVPDRVKVPAVGDRAITLKHLTTHTSGLPRMPGNFHPKDANNPYADYTLDQLYDFLGSVKPARAPGEGFEYSNFGVALLGNVLAAKEGKTFEALLIDRVCKPMGLEETRIALTDGLKRRLAPPHDPDLNLGHNWDLPVFAGAGAIHSTTSDLAKFVRAEIQLQPGALTASLKRSHGALAGADAANDIAYGWHIHKRFGVLWHNGQTGGYHSYVGFSPRLRAGIVVLGNCSSGTIDGAAFRVLAEMAGEKIPPMVLPHTITGVPEVLEQYAGPYLIFPGTVLTITREEDRLYAQVAGQGRCRIYPSTRDVFNYHAVDAQITFVAEQGKPATRLVLKQNGRDISAGRIESKVKPR